QAQAREPALLTELDPVGDAGVRLRAIDPELPQRAPDLVELPVLQLREQRVDVDRPLQGHGHVLEVAGGAAVTGPAEAMAGSRQPPTATTRQSTTPHASRVSVVQTCSGVMQSLLREEMTSAAARCPLS